MLLCFFFFKQKTAYEMRISDWSSDVCSSDLNAAVARHRARLQIDGRILGVERVAAGGPHRDRPVERHLFRVHVVPAAGRGGLRGRSEEHTSELQSLMRISYAVFCLKKKQKTLLHN